MNNLVVTVFPDEATADEGLRGLEELHREGTVTAYATAIIERAGTGELSVKRQGRGPLGDLLRRGLAGEVIAAVQRELTPGTSALVAEVSDDLLDPVVARLEALGGKVMHQRLTDFLSGLIEDDTADLRAEVADVSAEHAARKSEVTATGLDFDLENAREKLRRTVAQAGERLDRIKQEIGAKLDLLQDQAAKARPDVRDRIQQRIRDLRADLERREAKLREAVELATAALP
jgi:uncharacterized membrane protein